ncbi:MAG TPA: Sec-independent protein translocase protein TatB [Phenylobacterium sp.]|jgi:sec-independent protein translocase protein TatB|uniref:Sec-independent protein translocase protein TatB n=1 Tax=Phenylobacterium sp. TaxID=1871053 RepID=UPI002D4971F3|nr:Sec-independent protein translocase protein TatB [Phenylobacterium sp.]HZZ69321.1 Sec-independent protein translocase protein TatB [Phenylobacterium sp.]
MFPEGRAVEFLVAAIVALIVVGPKDLPVLLRKLGQFMAKVRSMAAEFRASFDEMARQSELDELRKEVEAMRKGQMLDMATHAPEVSQTFDEISQGLSDVGVSFDAPVNYPYVDPHQEAIEAAAAPKPRARKAAAKKTAAAKKAATARVTETPAAKKPATPKIAAKSKTAPKTAAPKAAPKAAAKATPAKPRARKAAAS